MDKIINFSYDSTSNSMNEVFITYYNEKGKKSTEILFLLGCSNITFVNIANRLKTSTVTSNPCVKDVFIDSEKVKPSKELLDYLIKGNELRLCFIGKSKLLVNKGNSYTIERIFSDFLFIDEYENKINLHVSYMSVDIQKLIPNSLFIVKYNSKKKLFCFTPIDVQFDETIIQSVKNKIEIRNSYLFDFNDIKTEYEVERKIFISTRIFFVFLLLSAIFLHINRVMQ